MALHICAKLNFLDLVQTFLEHYCYWLNGWIHKQQKSVPVYILTNIPQIEIIKIWVEHQTLDTLSEAEGQVIRSKAFIRCHHNLKIEAECRGSVNGVAHLPLRSEMIELMSSDCGDWNEVTHLGLHVQSRERENCAVWYSWPSKESPSLNP